MVGFTRFRVTRVTFESPVNYNSVNSLEEAGGGRGGSVGSSERGLHDLRGQNDGTDLENGRFVSRSRAVVVASPINNARRSSPPVTSSLCDQAILTKAREPPPPIIIARHFLLASVFFAPCLPHETLHPWDDSEGVVESVVCRAMWERKQEEKRKECSLIRRRDSICVSFHTT